MTHTRRNKKILLSFIGVFLFAGYVLFQSHLLLQGPVLSITYPTEGMTAPGPVLTVSGTAKNVAFVTMNGRQIFVNEQGEFSEVVVPAEGYSVISLKARDRFGRDAEVIRSFVTERPHEENSIVTNSPDREIPEEGSS